MPPNYSEILAAAKRAIEGYSTSYAKHTYTPATLEGFANKVADAIAPDIFRAASDEELALARKVVQHGTHEFITPRNVENLPMEEWMAKKTGLRINFNKMEEFIPRQDLETIMSDIPPPVLNTRTRTGMTVRDELITNWLADKYRYGKTAAERVSDEIAAETAATALDKENANIYYMLRGKPISQAGPRGKTRDRWVKRELAKAREEWDSRGLAGTEPAVAAPEPVEPATPAIAEAAPEPTEPKPMYESVAARRKRLSDEADRLLGEKKRKRLWGDTSPRKWNE